MRRAGSERKAALKKAAGAPVHVLSGVSGEGVDKVLSALLAEIKRDRAARAEEKKAGNVAEAGDGWTP
jgi:GTP-binding protein